MLHQNQSNHLYMLSIVKSMRSQLICIYSPLSELLISQVLSNVHSIFTRFNRSRDKYVINIIIISRKDFVCCGVHCAQCLVFCVMFCRLSIVLLSFFLWSLYSLSFVDLQFLITLVIFKVFLVPCPNRSSIICLSERYRINTFNPPYHMLSSSIRRIICCHHLCVWINPR